MKKSYRQEVVQQQTPDLDDLYVEVRDSLLESKRAKLELKAGEKLPVQTRQFILLVDGLVECLSPQSGARTAKAPYVAGLLEFATDRPGDILVTALKDSAYYEFSIDDFMELYQTEPWVREYLRRLYEYELKQLSKDLDAYQKHMQDFFVPGTAGLLPGPYEADDVDMVVLLMESEDPGWVDQQLPPWVPHLPGTGRRYMIAISRFGDVRCKHAVAGQEHFAYQETTVFVPCMAFGLPGFFAPILFPDNYMAIAIGREIYGFPKRFGKTRLDLANHYAELNVDRRLSYWLEWGEPEQVEGDEYVDRFVEAFFGNRSWADKAGDIAGWWFKRLFREDLIHTWPPVQVFVRQQVPDVSLPGETSLVYETDRLVRIPFEMFQPQAFYFLPELEFHAGKCDFLPPSRCVLAGHVKLDMRFGSNQQLWDYLGPLDRARLFARSVRRAGRRGVDVSHSFWELLRK